MLAWGYLSLYYKIYIVYRDFITVLIIGVLHFTITPISTFSRAFVSKIQWYLAEAIFYMIYMVYRDFIIMLIIGVLSFIITPISTFSRAFVSEIQ